MCVSFFALRRRLVQRQSAGLVRVAGRGQTQRLGSELNAHGLHATQLLWTESRLGRGPICGERVDHDHTERDVSQGPDGVIRHPPDGTDGADGTCRDADPATQLGATHDRKGAQNQDDADDQPHPAVRLEAGPEEGVFELLRNGSVVAKRQIASKMRMMPATPNTMEAKITQPCPRSFMTDPHSACSSPGKATSGCICKTGIYLRGPQWKRRSKSTKQSSFDGGTRSPWLVPGPGVSVQPTAGRTRLCSKRPRSNSEMEAVPSLHRVQLLTAQPWPASPVEGTVSPIGVHTGVRGRLLHPGSRTSHGVRDDLTRIHAMYFSTTVFTTVGFGDITGSRR